MRGCFKAAMAFGMVAVLSSPVLAQQGRGGFGMGMGGGPVNLLGNPSVQKELKLDEAQIAKVTGLTTATREKMASVREKVADLEGQERFTKQQELSKPINEEALKTAAEFLKPEQLKRLHQIELQQRGAMALSDPVVVKKLGITEEQTTKVKSILADQQSEMQEIRQAGGNDFQAMMPKITALRKETNTKVMGIMTEDQKKTWKEMTGEPFEVIQQPGRGGRGGRGGNP
jgi:hypothetical protein